MPSLNDRLISSVRRGDIKDTELLINFGANVRCRDKTPEELPVIHNAVRYNHPECLRLLLMAGAKHNVRVSKLNTTPLLLASEVGHLQCVHVLLSAGADPNAMDTLKCTPLLYACEKGYVDIVYLLLKHNADASRRDRNGWTPLLLSCHLGAADVVELLLKYGDANTEVTDERGRTPLMLCCLKEAADGWGHGQCAYHLVKFGANVRRKDRRGYTALHYALENGCPAAAEHMCCKKNEFKKGKEMGNRAGGKGDLKGATHKRNDNQMVDIDFVNMVEPTNGNSALHIGCVNGRSRSHALALRFLLSIGANFKAKNKRGKSPLDLAKEHGWSAIVRQLIHKLNDEDGKKDGGIDAISNKNDFIESKYKDAVDDKGNSKTDGNRTETMINYFIFKRYNGRIDTGVDGLCNAYDNALDEIKALKLKLKNAHLETLDGSTKWELERQDMLKKLLNLSISSE
jgi:uncharacterized protein